MKHSSLELYEQIVRDNPKRQDEGVKAYIRRIALLGGATGELLVKPMPEARLPYKETE